MLRLRLICQNVFDRIARSVAAYDAALQEFEQQLLDIDSLLNDYNRAVADYLSELESSPLTI